MTLGNAARVRLIVWCKSCGHQVEPDPAEVVARYGADTPVPDWRDRLVCSRCGSRAVDWSSRGPSGVIRSPSGAADQSAAPARGCVLRASAASQAVA
jgi:hypothetical protein